MPRKIRVGIIGTGGMARAHVGSYKQIPGVEVVACFDVVPGRAEQFAKDQGITHAVNAIDDLLSEVDAVSQVASDKAHCPINLAVLRAGKHLLAEKPLTLTLGEARQVAAAAEQASRKHGVIHMVNFSYRNSCAFQEACKVVASGALGELRHVHSHYLQTWLSADNWGNWTREAFLWRCQTAKGSGGVLGDVGCHILDFTTAIAGDLKAVRCTFGNFPKTDPKGRKVTQWDGVPLDANDSALMELHFTDGALGVCHTTRWATGHANTVAIEVHGDQGALSINLDQGGDKLNLCLGKARHKCQWTTKTIKPTPNNFQRFIKAVRTGKPEQADILRGAQVQAYLDACERSAKSRRLEEIRAWK